MIVWHRKASLPGSRPCRALAFAVFFGMISLVQSFAQQANGSPTTGTPDVATVRANTNVQRSHGGYYTAGRINNLRNNCDRYEWAQQQQKTAIKRAEYWVQLSDEKLWAMIPGQNLGRCIDVTFDRLTSGPRSLGCLQCGNAIKRFGNYPYTPDFVDKPWKLTCPSCGVVFPTNDFGRFYESAIDEHGLFNPAIGDSSLLFNEAHPDPEDPLHKFGVDNGLGYIDENGREHRFIGYYASNYWTHLNHGLAALADAYLYTGEKRYAHKAAIMLDRIADVYPDMDWKPYSDRGWYHSDGGRNLGKIAGSIAETGIVQMFANSYDKIISGTLDSPELFAFLQRQSEKYKLPTQKGTRELFIRNVDQRILLTATDAVLSEHIRGNQGMHQLTVAMCAVALNSEPLSSQWLQWLFEPDGGAIPGLMINTFDRDGTSNEGAPSYALMWGRLITNLASWVSSYTPYSRNNIFQDYPQLRATFLAAYRMAALGVAIPNIGDSGSTGLVSTGLIDPQFMALGYGYTRDPEIALAAYRANGNNAKNLAVDIFSADPYAISREIEAIATKANATPLGGRLMSGFGLALLEVGKGKHGMAVAANYGRTNMHAHPDMLNFDVFAFGRWLTPDHGYPEFATPWPSNAEWTGSTLSHNTVFVNEEPQKSVWGGHTSIFKQLQGFAMIKMDGRKAYPDVKDYNRTLYLIGGDDNSDSSQHAYVVDIFRVNGGWDHVYSFHGPPGEIAQNQLNLQTQKGGTYAGTDIPKGIWSKGFPIGYSHLYNVRRDSAPPASFVLDWKAEQGYRGLQGDVHLRLHVLNRYDDVALADGDPPQNKPGNPQRLGYALLHRGGDTLNTLTSTFVSVIEPYRDQPLIKSVTRLDDGNDGYVALQIELMDGRVDYLIHNDSSGTAVNLVNGMTVHGAAALYQEHRSKAARALLIDGTKLKFKKLTLSSQGAFTGKVVAMNRELRGGGWLVVDQQLPADGTLIGQQIVIDPSGERDACYTIEKVMREGDHTKIYCGPISFVRAYKGEEVVIRTARVPKDYTQGYLYDFEAGASFRISHHAEWRPDVKPARTKKEKPAFQRPK